MKLRYLVFLSVLGVADLSAQEPQPDSARIVPEAAVLLEGDTIFAIFSAFGPYKASERANIIQQRINHLLDQPSFSADSIYVQETETTSDILFQDMVILSVTDGDAAPVGRPRSVLADQVRTRLQGALREEQKSNSIFSVLFKIGLTFLELLLLYLVIKYLNRLFNWTRKKLIMKREDVLKGIRFKGYELLDTNRELQAVLFLNVVVKWTVIVLVLYLAIPVLFSIFPWTRGLADKLFGYILSPVTNIFWAIVTYVPNLFTIAVVFLATRYAVRFIKFLSKEVETGVLVIPGFYPDWAAPTYNIIKILLYAFMFVVIFPYLPGSDSEIFRGVSVFLGILFSLGSSTAIANAVAGLVITYMRPFKIGDRVKIGEVTGEVIEKSSLVTRVRTIKNEEVTIPNSTILSNHTINYTTSAKDLGLIVHTGVSIGYDVPWRQVHELLISAAEETAGILTHDQNRRPFVLQTSLDDFYVSYQINAFTEDSRSLAVIYSELHQNIQNKFNEAAVEILSPHYRAERNGNMTTIPAPYAGKPSADNGVNKSEENNPDPQLK